MSIRSISLRVFFPALLALAAAPLAATSYVMVSDEALVDGAPVAAVVRVVEVDRAVAQRTGGRPATEYRVQVEEALKGEIPGGVGGMLAVRVPGGVARNGMALKVYGAPRLNRGERALLFLDPAADGTWGVAHLLLGSFREVEDGGRRFAVRSLSGARELKMTSAGVEEGAGRDRLRDFDAFARWVADRAQGLRRASDYLVQEDEDGLKRITDKFTLFEDPDDGENMRWFNFDGGGNIKWSAYNAGQAGVTGGGYGQFQAALQTWNAESQTPIDYRYNGKTSNQTGLTDYDEVNTIVFNDPNGELPSFSCSAGGVLAYGGPWYFSDTTGFQGKQYHGIANADVVINNGLSCFFAASPNGSNAAIELFGHELGHTLGLGHSCGDADGPDPDCTNALFDDALMRAFIHDDARGGRLNADDQAGLRTLYQLNASPAAPSDLTATTDSTTSVDLAWTDNASNETAFEVEARTLTGDFAVVATLPANSTSTTVGSLASATGYVFRVKAVNASGSSGYSNEASTATNAVAGPCVADDHTLCLSSGRFRVQVAWETGAGDSGLATSVPVLSDDSGLLWFFNSSNWEMLLKVLNGCGFPQPRYWVFFAATTDVEFVVTVTDTQTGKVKVYLNPQGVSADSVTDTDAFATCP
ncbi:MAG TPA: fibronectin type III domain-containing protein [Thermoanaerobaculia bacterium]|nr:fibronectin type III domain-containing protein [Thermoanaerobaculia bacterium]